MRSCLVRPLLGVLLLAAGGCATRAPALAEVDPLRIARAARAPLPDEEERAVGRLAALVLAGRPDSAVAVLQELELREQARLQQGLLPTGLADNARDLVESMGGPAGYNARAEMLLEREDLDPGLRRRLQGTVDQQPLRYAEKRMREERRFKLGTMFNRILSPLSRLATSGALNPIESVRSLIASLLTFRSFPESSPRERQALRAYEEYLTRHPSNPDSNRVRDRAWKLRKKLDATRVDEALAGAERALALGQPEAARLRVERAEQVRADDPRALQLRAAADQLEELQRARVARSLAAREPEGEESAQRVQLASRLLSAPRGELALGIGAGAAGSELEWLADDERSFLVGIEALERGDEDAFFAHMKQTATSPGAMGRHAQRALQDPARNAHARYRAEIRSDRRRQAGWLLLGRHAQGAIRRDLPRPLEYLIDAPGIAISILTLPIRMLQYPRARASFGARVLTAAETYLARYPQGQHSSEVRRDLEKRLVRAGRWGRALELHLAGAQPDAKTLERYRGQIAEQLLDSAKREERNDMRAAIYRSVLQDYGSTEAGPRAAEALRELMANATPQGIRLSREFLREHPALWGPGALGLRPELLDDESGNGELARSGITLLGRHRVRVELEDRDPVERSVPPEHFARFISLLEEASYRQLATDPRETPAPDPQRDLFFERARLGLLDEPDARPTARSEAVFLGTHEKHGPVRARESILPIDLVVRGDFETMGFSPVPRIRVPAPPPDAFLYE